MANAYRDFNEDKEDGDDRWRGAIIDGHGREQPITERMIARACAALDASYSIGVSSENPAPEAHGARRR